MDFHARLLKLDRESNEKCVGKRCSREEEARYRASRAGAATW